jgi:hypothetical protein
LAAIVAVWYRARTSRRELHRPAQTQTAEQYAADDLETMREAKRYGAHLFRLFRRTSGGACSR